MYFKHFQYLFKKKKPIKNPITFIHNNNKYKTKCEKRGQKYIKTNKKQQLYIKLINNQQQIIKIN